MTTEVLGKLIFSETPEVNGSEVLLNAGGVPTILSDITANRPAAGIVGRLFLDVTLNRFYRDNGTSWDDLTPAPLLDGTAGQIVVTDGTNVTPSVVSFADNPVLPGTEGVVLPGGSTAQRPASPIPGEIRYNSTLGYNEKYTGSHWGPLGLVLQQVTGTIPASTGSTQLPWDNTVPLITEGVQIWSTSFTPISATSRIIVQFAITVASSVAARASTTAVFYGNTIFGASGNYCQTVNVPYNTSLSMVRASGSTATVTIQARTGLNGTGTSFVNQTSAGTLGGAAVSQYTITEIE